MEAELLLQSVLTTLLSQKILRVTIGQTKLEFRFDRKSLVILQTSLGLLFARFVALNGEGAVYLHNR